MITEETVTPASDVLDTPPLARPLPVADAHRARITAITPEYAKTGSIGIKVSLRSQDTGFDTDFLYWPPFEFSSNIHVDPNTLPDTPALGKKQSARERYAIVVSNTHGTAELQALRALAKEAGRTTEGFAAPEDFDQYVALHNNLLSGIDVIFTRAVEEDDSGQYEPRLKVNRIHSITKQDNPKAFKSYVKRWE